MTPAAYRRAGAPRADLIGTIASAVDLDAAKATATDESQRLLSAVLRPDEPGGVWCLPLQSSTALGLCHGSGHRVAAAYGYAAGIGVFVAIDGIAERVVRDTAGTIAGGMHQANLDAGRWPARAAEIAAPMIARSITGAILAIVAHEAAHAIALPIDATTPTAAEAEEIRASANDFILVRDHAWTVKHHAEPWAAAYAIVAARLVALEPDCQSEITERMRHDTRYVGGIAFDAVAAVVADVPHDAPIRPLLADADFIARVSAVVPTADERLATLTAADGPQRNVDSETSCGVAARKFG